MKTTWRLVFLAAALCSTGCAVVTAVGVRILYRKAEWPERWISRDIDYGTDHAPASPKRRLDLYRPATRGWPVLVFVHGGNWDSGDKQLRVGGADVYANIGRYFASQGIGVAVINYRLQPTVTWRDQIADVRSALRWLRGHVQEEGGRSDALYMMGHSAGGYLSSFVALDSSDALFTPVRGVICVSGAGLDLSDEPTYALGEDRQYYEKRFRGGDTSEAWKRIASPVSYVRPTAPPFLILFAQGEKRALHRQAQVLAGALERAGVRHTTTVVPGESHARIVLTLSHPGKSAVPAILAFIRDTEARHDPPPDEKR